MAAPTGPEPAAEWADVLEALAFAQSCFVEFGRDILAGPTAGRIVAAYQKQRDLLSDAAKDGTSRPEITLPPLEGTGPAARSIRLWRFVAREIRRLEQDGQLSLAAAHVCIAQADERFRYFYKRLGP